jgi:hypothetical protein
MRRHAAQSEKIIGPEELDPVLTRKALAGKDFFFDLIYGHIFYREWTRMRQE